MQRLKAILGALQKGTVTPIGKPQATARYNVSFNEISAFTSSHVAHNPRLISMTHSEVSEQRNTLCCG